ncbi:MAG TPA: hypothetical protein VMJ34_01175 [Bryobacteraceae bacterium]|nr:hypothetical protein [Bryobacteraceae bacterium]
MSLRRYSLWLAASSCAFAQAPAAVMPPPGVEEALRQRVRPFYEAHVDSKYRKAYDVVADDSKDAFLVANKVHYDGFEVQKIAFKDNFTEAVVTTQYLTTMRFFSVAAPEKNVEESRWKLMDGQWYWYSPAAEPTQTAYTPAQQALMQRLNIMAPGAQQAPAAATAPANGVPAQALPPGLSGMPPGMASLPPGMLSGLPVAPAPGGNSTAAAAAPILQQLRAQVRLEKQEVVLNAHQAGKTTVKVRNATRGVVGIALVGPQRPGLTLTLDKTQLTGDESATISIDWDPSASSGTPAPVSYKLSIQPSGAFLPLNIRFQ